mgnify:CR=1 FL=1
MDYSSIVPVLARTRAIIPCGYVYKQFRVDSTEWIYIIRTIGDWTLISTSLNPKCLRFNGPQRDCFREITQPNLRLKYNGQKVFTYSGTGSVGPICVHNSSLLTYFLIIFK